jgi:hypothetical protein
MLVDSKILALIVSSLTWAAHMAQFHRPGHDKPTLVQIIGVSPLVCIAIMCENRIHLNIFQQSEKVLHFARKIIKMLKVQNNGYRCLNLRCVPIFYIVILIKKRYELAHQTVLRMGLLFCGVLTIRFFENFYDFFLPCLVGSNVGISPEKRLHSYTTITLPFVKYLNTIFIWNIYQLSSSR